MRVMMSGEDSPKVAWLGDGGRSSEPRTVGSSGSWKCRQPLEALLPQNLQNKGCQHLALVQRDPFQTFDLQNCKAVHLGCLKPLSFQ